MHYRYSPRNVFIGVVTTVAAVAYFLIEIEVAANQWWPYAVLAFALVLSGSWWLWDSLSDERHGNKMAKFAGVNKWEFHLRTFDYDRRFVSFPFATGVNAEDRMVIRGVYNGERCASFTHTYEERTDDDRRATYHWQITLVELDVALPSVDILPDDLVAKMAKLVGGQDIDFESAEFNRKWRVKARDRKYAHDIVHPRVMERLNRDDAAGLAIRVEGAAVLAWQVDRRGPEDLARRLGVLTSIAKLIPEFVVRNAREAREKAEEEQRWREANAPAWATTPYALTSGRYTGIGAEEYAQEDSRDGEEDDKPGASGG